MADEENALTGDDAESLEEQITPEATPEEVTAEPEQVEEEAATDEQPQIDANTEILKKLEKLERRQMYLQRKLETPVQQPQYIPEKPQLPAEAPKEADFDSYDAYRDALEDYKIAKQIDSLKSDMSQQQRQAELNTFIGNLTREGQARYQDFQEVTQDPTLPITTPMVDMLRNYDNPADIAYYLGKNPVECSKIANMSPVQAARELAKIETKVGAGLKKSPVSKTVTQAPKPITPSKTGGEPISKNPEKMSQAEYEQWRRSQGARLY